VAEGYKEVVLTGTKIGLYRYQGTSLKGLLQRLLAETDVGRLRLSSLQPSEVSPELIGLWRDKRLCRHFHLSLQSGSDGVLRRMKRGYSAGGYLGTVALIRDMVPEAAITTDVIVGFPGETGAEFEESYELCRQIGFARIHVFSYSPRQGTQAARMSDGLGDRVKGERSHKLLALAQESAQRFRQKFLGRTMAVLWEKQAGGVWTGLTDNYIRVYTGSSEDLTNRLLPARLAEIKSDGVWGVFPKG
jgi:threonylcarbamoyladenosine tRNA methylthiotransferase MtaB